MERFNLPIVPFKSSRAAATMSALVALVVLAVIGASVLRTVLPRFHVTHQTAAWQEARLAAEAGIDLALERLNQNVPNPTASTADWTGWKKSASSNASGNDLAKSTATSVAGIVASGNALTASPSIYLDNADVSNAAGLPASADVQLTALFPSPNDGVNSTWFRVRSMGTAAAPGPKRAAFDRMDTSLRKLNLRSMRGNISANDAFAPTTVPLPNASRIVEVLARPVHPFATAILTDQDMTLGNSSNWRVDSYDSSDPNKSAAGGTYPKGDNSKIQKNGDIASNKPGAAVGALISANGAVVLGDVSTNGGDDPNTTAHENVSGAGGIDPARIHDDFYDPLVTIFAPTDAANQTNPVAGAPYQASTTQENIYWVDSLGAFRVQGSGKIRIVVRGDWNVGTGGGAVVEIPNTVYATIYVRGNINFGNGTVNMNAASSKKAPQLIVYGVPEKDPVTGTIPTRTLDAQGNAEVAVAFYGPSYAVEYNGTVEWYGAVHGKSFRIRGGGNGGFHYDESLAGAGFIKRFEISSYFEDSRQ